MKAVFLLAIFALLGATQARVFTRCGLARELARQGLPRHDLANWVCLIEAESGRNTRARGGPNYDGSYDNGLFQINDRIWCMNGRPGHACHVRCEDLRTDDIRASVRCAVQIKQQQGWSAWYGWQYHCRGRPLPDINVCF
uniref:lysozyme n=3 Tax=Rhodnius prolixus TaxID=13249 RepID=A9LN31_RHOPR|nr:lysozyme-1 [Rhodnius prolixus]